MSEKVEEIARTFPKSVQPGIPKLKEPKPGWRTVRFGDVLSPVVRPIKMDDNSEYRLVTVKRSRGGIEERARMQGRQISVKSQFELQGGDFLISKRQIVHGACGVVADDFEGAIVSNEYSVLRCSSELDLKFLGYLSHSVYFQQTCFHSSIGVHVEKMIFKLEDWFDWPVNLPSLPEQQKIAAFLGAVDGKIEALRRQVAALARFKAGLMQQLFSQKLRFTRDDGAAFPEWDVRELQDIGQRCKSKNAKLELTRVLTNSATKGVIDQGDYFDKDIANAENIDSYGIIRKGEFVYNPRISVSAPVGPINRNDLADGIMSPLYTIFRIDLKDTDFFAHYFRSTLWHEYMKSVANYGARHDRMAISTADFMALPLPFPHPDEQRKIADALSALDAKITALRGQISKMEAFKKGLLQQMFV